MRSPDDPPSRKKLFNDTDFQTHKDRDNEFLFEQVVKSDVQADAASNYMVMEESDGQAKVVAKSDGLTSKSDVDKHSSDPRADAPADSKMVEDVDNQTILDENELKEINDCVQLCIEEMVQKEKPSTKNGDLGLGGSGFNLVVVFDLDWRWMVVWLWANDDDDDGDGRYGVMVVGLSGRLGRWV
ncbi:hypothetical protein LWI29_031405 [Acer saccharum]|uniref:Uncharacterized protein n=1 Tax=Acer saccharum TaxID=4024 RepID=A0AA39S8X1_ACESA|nr:hypothetical protein LWI29_031405 [Acer saccharum]